MFQLARPRLDSLRNDIAISGNLVANLNQVIEGKTKEVKSLDCKQQRLLDGILRLMGTKEYKKVKDIAREQVDTIMNDKKTLLAVMLFAILEALKLDPEKQILISNLSSCGGGQSYIVEQHRKELLGLSEQIHDKIANELVNTTVNKLSYR